MSSSAEVAARGPARHQDQCEPLSGRQPQSEGFVEHVAHVLHDTGLPPETLTVEITESVFIRESVSVLARLQAVRALGVRLSLDDFGTGYSSLRYLPHFRVDQINIDRSFVQGVRDIEVDPALLRKIVGMAEAIDAQTFGEGIEHESQLRALQEIGCDRGQGFYFSRPITGDALTELMDQTLVGVGAVP